MISSAFTLQKTGKWAALAACLAVPLLGQAQAAQDFAQTGNYGVQPVYVDGGTLPTGGSDLASPVYASPTAPSGTVPRAIPPMPANAQVIAPAETMAQVRDSDPNNGLVKVEMVRVGEAVTTTTTTRTTQLAANPPGSTQAQGIGWRLNSLKPESVPTSLSLTGDAGSFATYMPKWDGSAEHMILALPYADLQVGNRVYLSTDRGLGINLLASRNAAMSVALDYRFPRRDLDVLRPIDRVDGALTLGGRINLYVQELEFFLNTDIDIYGEMTGLDVQMGLSSVQPITKRLALKLTGAVTAADKELLNNRFQVTAAESAALSVPEYSVDRFGLQDMRVKGELKYFFTDHIGIYGASEVKVLLDEVAESPLVDDLGDAVQFSSNLGLIYRF